MAKKPVKSAPKSSIAPLTAEQVALALSERIKQLDARVQALEVRVDALSSPSEFPPSPEPTTDAKREHDRIYQP